MNPDPENFEQLRRMLVLKRYEQPPPGYFEHFSGNVVDRIRAETAGSGGWLRRVLSVLEAKPVFAGAFGVAVCSILISGILNSEESGIASNPAANSKTAQAGGFGDSASGTSLSVAENVAAPLQGDPISSLGALFNVYPTVQPVSLDFRAVGN